MEQNERLEIALHTLKTYLLDLANQAGLENEYGIQLWEDIRQSLGLLRELAYYHDYGSFLCEYRVEGYTLADVLVWQVDHFKFYMDRPEEMNRYRQERLLLTAFETMIKLERNPEPIKRKIMGETGQDRLN